MKTFKIRAFFTADQKEFVETEIKGKNLGEAFYKYFIVKAKNFNTIKGFIEIQ